MIKEKWPQAEVIAGTATAGIPHAAWIAAELDLPMVYVRSKPKDHGRGKQIEGVLPAGAKTILIDDLISTGGSVLKAVAAARNEGADVIGVAGIFSYQLAAATENFAKEKLEFVTLTNYGELLDAAIKADYVSADQRSVLEQWRQDTAHWTGA